jgi:phytoene dehydrogenase-like protein
MMQQTKADVVIIGAGIAGLTVAKLLKKAGKKIILIEAADDVGGRVRTDEKDGFLIDRGFQVLLTAYPEAKELLDYKRLNLKKFKPGATILNKTGKHKIGDPSREPLLLFKTLFSSVGNFSDKLMLLSLKLKLASKSVEDIFEKQEITTLEYLRQYGFSELMINQFFRPFFSGIFLENELSTSSRMFEFVFKMFGKGHAAIPANGMGMISKQLAEGLLKEELFLNEKVSQINQNIIITKSGLSFHAPTIVIATDALNAAKLTDQKLNLSYKSALTLYFSADEKTKQTGRIALNAIENQMVNNIAFLDHISAAYAPKEKSLIAVSLKDFDGHDLTFLETKVRTELLQWYPESVNWKLLSTQHINYALPDNESVKNNITDSDFKIKNNLFICGDHLINGSINAAMKTGKEIANQIIALN